MNAIHFSYKAKHRFSLDRIDVWELKCNCITNTLHSQVSSHSDKHDGNNCCEWFWHWHTNERNEARQSRIFNWNGCDGVSFPSFSWNACSLFVFWQSALFWLCLDRGYDLPYLAIDCISRSIYCWCINMHERRLACVKYKTKTQPKNECPKSTHFLRQLHPKVNLFIYLIFRSFWTLFDVREMFKVVLSSV